MAFRLGSRSREELAGVHPDLVLVVKRAIQLTTQDFAVHQGLRALREQRVLVAKGVSWTLNSKHLEQPDGFAHAVDLVPVIGGSLSWDWVGCYAIAAAMARAGSEVQVELRWGGVWDRPMKTYAGSCSAMQVASQQYVKRRRAAGKRSAIDGPHFELMK